MREHRTAPADAPAFLPVRIERLELLQPHVPAAAALAEPADSERRSRRSLRADFGAVVVNMRAGGPLTLPEARATVIIHDVSALNAAEQDRLYQWLNLSPPGISVIGVTSEPMFPLVQRGAFLTDLFYRLNLIVIDVTDGYV